MRGIEQVPWLYDAMLAVAEWTGLARWRAWLVRGAKGRALDVGCGTGRNLALFGAGVRPVGLDPEMDALRAARRKAPFVPLVRGSVEALPFRDGAFDTVVSGLVFCSVRQPLQGLAETKRVLRPDGELRMLEHVRATTRLGARWQDATQPLWTWIAGGCHRNRDTERTVELAGFTISPEGRRARDTMRRFAARKRVA
ncbi:MAG: class I SAM-dependent methyltransferase [Myxococcales bacterium]